MNIFTRTSFLALLLTFVSLDVVHSNLLTRTLSDNSEEAADFHLGFKELLEKYPDYREKATSFHSKEKIKVEQKDSLYVGQNEFAVTGPDDKSVTILGSDGATGAIIAILRHPGSKVTGIGFFDGVETYVGVKKMVEKVISLTQNSEDTYELSLIGGTDDEPTENAFKSLIQAFYEIEVPFKLVLANIGELNTVVRDGISWPVFYGAGVNVKTGEIFPTESFAYKGPEPQLRVSRALTGLTEFLDIYDSSNELVKFTPEDFQYEPLKQNIIDAFQQSDEDLLQSISTAPSIEPKDFIPQLRDAYKFLQEHPSPNTVFKNQQPITYARNEKGVWTKNQD